MWKIVQNNKSQSRQAAQPKSASVRRFSQDTNGTTAIEFAILGIPFIGLLFGIIELALVFFISSTSQHALETTAREIRTGEFQLSGVPETEIVANICRLMGNSEKCVARTRVDVVTSPTGSFSDITLPDTNVDCEPDDDDCKAEAPPVTLGDYACTTGGDIVVVRVEYLHPLSMPSTITRLGNASGNTRKITHTTAFRNEPFSFTC